jgi:hypothetical protein
MDTDFGEWQAIASAPKDGTRVLVAVRASEQGPAEVDVARWARPERTAEPCWIAADSDPAAPIIYAEAELAGWMPMPAPQPRRPAPRPRRAKGEDEMGGSGI